MSQDTASVRRLKRTTELVELLDDIVVQSKSMSEEDKIRLSGFRGSLMLLHADLMEDMVDFSEYMMTM